MHKTINVKTGHTFWSQKYVIMEQKVLFPSGVPAVFQHKYILVLMLMYSSNLNINIHWAFVTFKILLDALQSILVQIALSNYAFKLITTDQPPLIVFRACSSLPCTAYATGSGCLGLQTGFLSWILAIGRKVYLVDLVSVTVLWARAAAPGAGWLTALQKAAVFMLGCSQTIPEPREVRLDSAN